MSNKKIKDYFVISLISILGLITAQILAGKTSSDYNSLIHELISDDFKSHLADKDKNFDKDWVNPGARMASRIFHDNRDRIVRIANNLSSKKTTFDIWKESGAKSSEVLPYYYLSLLAGDLTSGYLIIKNSTQNKDYHYEDTWLLKLTETYWLGANEYLHELDYGRAAVYNNLYLSASREISGLRKSGDINDVDRNRTLSHILQREYIINRIKSMCNDPGVESSFGKILLGRNGIDFPENNPSDLLERRRKNKSFHCDINNNETIPYNDIYFLKAGNIPPKVCELWPLECEYNYLSSAIFKGEHNDIYNEMIEFLKSCSYLSDDLLYWYIHEISYREETQGYFRTKKIPFSTINRVALCSEKIKSDKYAKLIKEIENLKCSRIYLDSVREVSSDLRKIKSRCDY